MKDYYFCMSAVLVGILLLPCGGPCPLTPGFCCVVVEGLESRLLFIVCQGVRNTLTSQHGTSKSDKHLNIMCQLCRIHVIL